MKITVGISGTGGGFEKFCAGETDISDASRPIEPDEEKACQEEGVEYGEAQVANDGIAVVVNPENDWADCLTTAELKKIWEPSSKVNNWNQVKSGFPDEQMELFGAGTDSGTFDYFTEQINGEEGASRKDYSPSEDDNVTVQGVSGGKGNIGYFGLSYAIANKDKVKTVQVDAGDGCVEPTDATVQDASYKPLSRPLLIYPSQAGAAERGDGGVRQVLRRQLRGDRQAGAVRADDRGTGSEGPGRGHPAGGLVGGSVQEQKHREPARTSRAGSPFPGAATARALVKFVLLACAAVSVLTTIGIVVALAEPTIEFFQDVSLGEFFTGTDWSPLFTPSSFGVLPLVVGTLSTTLWACLVAIPFGLGAAIYMSEYARPSTRALAEAGARGAGRHPHGRLRVLRADRGHAVPAGHRHRRNRVQRPVGRPGDGRDDPAHRRLAVRRRDDGRADGAARGRVRPGRLEAAGLDASRGARRAVGHRGLVRARDLARRRGDDDRRDRGRPAGEDVVQPAGVRSRP